MAIRRILLATGLTAFTLLTALAQSGGTAPYRQRLPEGEVSWYEGWIRVRAEVPLMQGVPRAQAQVDARRVAVMKAQASALRMAMRIPVDADRRLEELEAVRVKVQGIVRGGEVLEEKLEGNKVTLVFQVPLAGVKGISSEVYTVIVPELATPPSPPMVPGQPAPQAGRTPPPTPAPKPKPRGLSTFAAVRVEAEDAGAKPALYPKIVDPSGEPVYSAATVKPEVAKTRTIARYVSRNETGGGPRPQAAPWGGALPLAIVDPRRWILAQQQPPPPPPPPPSPIPKSYEYQSPPSPFEEEELVVRAVAAKGKLKADLVVTAVDAQRLRENASLLENANVIVVVRTDVGGVESKKGNRSGEILFGRR